MLLYINRDCKEPAWECEHQESATLNLNETLTISMAGMWQHKHSGIKMAKANKSIHILFHSYLGFSPPLSLITTTRRKFVIRMLKATYGCTESAFHCKRKRLVRQLRQAGCITKDRVISKVPCEIRDLHYTREMKCKGKERCE